MTLADRMLAIAATLALAACINTAPATLTANVSGGDPFACASSKLTSLGYTIESATKDAGVVRASKRDGPFVTTVTATVFTEAGVQKLRVITDAVNHYDGGQKQQHLGSTKYTRADAQAVLDACSA